MGDEIGFYSKLIGKEVIYFKNTGILTAVRELEDGMILGYIDENIIANITTIQMMVDETKMYLDDIFTNEAVYV